jgi:serine/threonine-protein phosphatase 2B catalytic subunit
MNGEQPTNPAPARGMVNRIQIDNAIRALQNKKPVPEIDFTLHTMEDGSQASTLERVCKGTMPSFKSTPHKAQLLAQDR